MIGFIISTIAFLVAVSLLNRYLDAQDLGQHASRKLLVMVVATVVSIGAGWMADKLDGDANLPQKSMVEVLQSGDPVQMAKLLAGINP